MVWLKIGDRPAMNIRIVKRLEGDRYRLDWGQCGFNSILNTVSIPAKSLSAEPKS